MPITLLKVATSLLSPYYGVDDHRLIPSKPPELRWRFVIDGSAMKEESKSIWDLMNKLQSTNPKFRFPGIPPIGRNPRAGRIPNPNSQ